MKNYIIPNTQVMTINMTLCQAASPGEGGLFLPFGHGGEGGTGTNGQSGAM